MRSDLQQNLLNAFEVHSPDQIRQCLAAGIDVHQPIDGKQPVDWLIEMYLRSPRFADCLRMVLDAGAALPDDLLRMTLLDDGPRLAAALAADPQGVHHRVDLPCAFTPLGGASLLHVAAEYGHAAAAQAMLDAGADVNAKAATDAHGLGGHTPVFHTVNQHANHSLPILRMLIEEDAHLDVRLQGLTWGEGFEWETTLFDVTPLSYAQLGLLPQMHRKEADVYANVRLLLEAQGRPVPPLRNVPNRYLQR